MIRLVSSVLPIACASQCFRNKANKQIRDQISYIHFPLKRNKAGSDLPAGETEDCHEFKAS